jgi:hypothetical protein
MNEHKKMKINSWTVGWWLRLGIRIAFAASSLSWFVAGIAVCKLSFFDAHWTNNGASSAIMADIMIAAILIQCSAFIFCSCLYLAVEKPLAHRKLKGSPHIPTRM